MSVNPSTQKADVEDLKFEASLDYILTVILSQQINAFIHSSTCSCTHSLTHEPSVSQELFLDAFLVAAKVRALSTVAQSWALENTGQACAWRHMQSITRKRT